MLLSYWRCICQFVHQCMTSNQCSTKGVIKGNLNPKTRQFLKSLISRCDMVLVKRDMIKVLWDKMSLMWMNLVYTVSNIRESYKQWHETPLSLALDKNYDYVEIKIWKVIGTLSVLKYNVSKRFFRQNKEVGKRLPCPSLIMMEGVVQLLFEFLNY
jgi:hypothetical protein